MRLLRRLAAVLLVGALLWQGGGVVNALEIDPTAHCCCGDHDGAEACGCPDCPGHGGLRWAKARPRTPPPAGAPSMRSCRGRAGRAELVSLPRVAPPSPPALAPPAAGEPAPAPADAPPALVLADPLRPPW